jgi:hypothetical protein
MNLISNFNPDSTQISVLYYYPFDCEILLHKRNITNFDKLASNPEKTIIVTSGFLNNSLLDESIKNVLIYRIKNKLPTYLIYDFSFEYHLQETEIDIIVAYFSNIGLDVEKHLLILNNHFGNHYTKEKPYTFTYDIWAIDGFFWLTTKPEKFTNLSLSKRPKLANLILSKLTVKQSRVKIAYEFYKNDLLKQCLLSVMGNLKEFSEVVDDEEFLKEIDQRIINVGGTPVLYQEGTSNKEFMCETSNRIIFNNSVLSCVLETAFSENVNGQTSWSGNGFLTEKFYRCIVNKTPFIIYGTPKVYRQVREMGFNDFGSVIDLSFDSIFDEQEKIEKYTTEVVKFLDNFEDRMTEIQAICDYNYEVFLNKSRAEYKYYQDRITNFLN